MIRICGPSQVELFETFMMLEAEWYTEAVESLGGQIPSFWRQPTACLSYWQLHWQRIPLFSVRSMERRDGSRINAGGKI
jgi:hypothetical protein